ncbi:MAG: DUF4440 domain-containing protein [Acidimicrobiales bacterium]|nr:DUF4440 domain-containing protein [Hyphomonadaceae bacterium]RZV43361.1 MAG: DUF4440 domain-containing protein [Acidimicrobiales bacterium]
MTDAEQIQKLELLLLDPKIRQSANKLDQLLSDGFIEIGQSGRIYDKRDIISALADDPHTDAKFSNFDIRALSETLILASYTSRNKTTIQRHSLWEKHGLAWRILYHEAEAKNG